MANNYIIDEYEDSNDSIDEINPNISITCHVYEHDNDQPMFMSNSTTILNIEYTGETFKAIVNNTEAFSLSNIKNEADWQQVITGVSTLSIICDYPDLDQFNLISIGDRFTSGSGKLFAITNKISTPDSKTLYSLADLQHTFNRVNARVIPVADLAPATLSNTSIGVQIHSLINNIQARTDDNIDLQVNKQMIPLKATPVDVVDGKVYMFMDWFDYDIVMAEYVARKFLTPAKLDTLLAVNGLEQIELDLINDVLGLSYLYSTNFQSIPRYTDQEASAAGGGAKAGDLKPDQTFGSKQIPIITYAGQDPVKAVDSLFEIYYRENPFDSDNPRIQLVKQVVASLSKYCYTSMAIGGGLNAFNEIYLPWYLQPTNTIGIETLVNSNWKLKTDITYELKSRYFKVGGAIDVNPTTDISNVKIVQSDRKITIPLVQGTMPVINKMNKPVDIRPNDQQSLAFMWYIPNQSHVAFNKIFLNDPNVTADNTNVAKTFNSDWHTDTITDQMIIDDFVKQYSVAHAQVTLTDKGTLQERPGPTAHAFSNADIPKLLQDLPHLLAGEKETWDTSSVSDTAQIKKWINMQYGTDISAIENLTGSITFELHKTRHPYYTFVTSTLRWHIKEHRYENAKVNFSGTTTTYSTKRDVLVDKENWKHYIKEILQLPEQVQYYSFTDKYTGSTGNLKEISINQIWGDELILKIGTTEIKIPLFNKENELLANHKILVV